MENINIEDFFDFESQKPVNRIAYTEEDAKYKLKYIKKMLDLGMNVSIDNVGNICGEIPGKYAKDVNIVMGSHTDSVKDGGQFDGPVGVYMALKAAENYNTFDNKEQYGNLKVVIYACEESTRFSTACIGSYYLNGEFSEEMLSNLKDKSGKTFNEIISEYKEYLFLHFAEYGIDLNKIKLVDKIITPEEVSEAFESHIEQSEILTDSGKSIGIVDSIGKPVRGEISVKGKNSIVTSAQIIEKLTQLAKKSKSSNNEEALRITIPRFHTVYADKESKKTQKVQGNIFAISAKGENNHSGATPMDERKDAVTGLSKLILMLNELKEKNPEANIKFLSTSTPKWGANQVQNQAYLNIQMNPKYLSNLEDYILECVEENNINFEISSLEEIVIPENPSEELFADMRQQYPVNQEQTKNDAYNIFKNIQEELMDGKDSIYFKVTSQGTPIQTSEELLKNVEAICKDKKYPYRIMHSWPGHDLACVLPQNNTHGKRILFFIPSQGGSHNPKETTNKEAINIGTEVYSELILQRMKGIKDNYNKKEIAR